MHSAHLDAGVDGLGRLVQLHRGQLRTRPVPDDSVRLRRCLSDDDGRQSRRRTRDQQQQQRNRQDRGRGCLRRRVARVHRYAVER